MGNSYMGIMIYGTLINIKNDGSFTTQSLIRHRGGKTPLLSERKKVIYIMKIFDFIPHGVDEGTVTAWLHESERFAEMRSYAYKRPAIVICPGGGYEIVSEREAEPVAKQYFAAGYNTFILRYSVKEKAKDFYPLCQLACTVAHVREFADEWHIAKDKIAVIGFSAGGHLACSLGTLFNKEHFLRAFGKSLDIRPDAMILSYPVITADEFAHKGSICRVSGDEAGSEKYESFGLEQYVDSQTPPTFLWHTAEDKCVPVENSLSMAKALSAAGVSFEMHIFPKGNHGSSVCNNEVNSHNPYNARWVEWSIKWLNEIFKFEV